MGLVEVLAHMELAGIAIDRDGGRRWVTLGVAFNVGLLGALKYAHWLLGYVPEWMQAIGVPGDAVNPR